MEMLSKEEMEKKIAELNVQMELFTMSLQYEDLQVKFRETYDAWYEKRITLGASLQRMMDNMTLCSQIGVWS